MIRKISIGPDYKSAMHYSVGQPFNRVVINAIRKTDSGSYEVYVQNDNDEVILWKEFVGMPVVVEFDVQAFS